MLEVAAVVMEVVDLAGDLRAGGVGVALADRL